MKSHWFYVLAVSCLAGLASGCQQRNEIAEPKTPVTALQAEGNDGSDDNPDLDKVSEAPDGWKTYEPADGGFTVFAPGNPPDVSTEELKMWKQKSYTFQEGAASLAIEIYSERTGAVATNTVDDLRDSPDIVPGSLRDLTLSGMPGIQFRTRGLAGEVVHREYCSPDNSRSISIIIQKDVGNGIPEEKFQQFLDSFKLKQ